MNKKLHNLGLALILIAACRPACRSLAGTGTR